MARKLGKKGVFVASLIILLALFAVLFFLPASVCGLVDADSMLLFPHGVASSTAGSVIVLDTGNNRILKTTPSLVGWSAELSGFSSPEGIAVDSSGYVYVADTGANRIVKISPSISEILSEYGNLSSPSGISVDSGGYIYIADTGANRVIKLNPSLSSILAEFVGLSSPKDVAVSPDGNFVMIADTGSDRVIKTSPTLSGTLAEYTSLSSPEGVSVTPESFILIADTGNDRVLRLSSSLATVLAEYEKDAVDDPLNAPAGIMYDASSLTDNKVFVADTAHNRILKLDSGMSNVLAYKGNASSLEISLNTSSITFHEGESDEAAWVLVEVENPNSWDQHNLVLSTSGASTVVSSVTFSSPTTFSVLNDGTKKVVRAKISPKSSASEGSSGTIIFKVESSEGALVEEELDVEIESALPPEDAELDAQYALEEVKSGYEEMFETISDMEKQGVNVSSNLTSILSEVEDLISDAEDAFDGGDFEECSDLCSLAGEKMDAAQQLLMSEMISGGFSPDLLPEDLQDAYQAFQGGQDFLQSVTAALDWLGQNSWFVVLMAIVTLLSILLFHFAMTQLLVFASFKADMVKQISSGIIVLFIVIVMLIKPRNAPAGGLMIAFLALLLGLCVLSGAVFFLACPSSLLDGKNIAVLPAGKDSLQVKISQRVENVAEAPVLPKEEKRKRRKIFRKRKNQE